MSNPIPDDKWPLMAEIFDAIDPDRTPDQRIESSLRAAGMDPRFAFAALAGLATAAISALPDPSGAMAQLRARTAAGGA